MSDRGALWYKREPRAFLEGVRQMTHKEVSVYAIILDLIYDGGHATRDDPKHIASYFSDLGTASVRNAIDALVEAGKLERDGGFLTNKRAKNEGKTREELRKIRSVSGRLGGISSGNSRSKPNVSNRLDEANASDKLSLDIEREIEEEAPKGALSETSSDDTPKKRKKHAYTEAFDGFWKAYPTTPNMSKAEAFAEWKKLDEEDRSSATAAIPSFKAYLKTKPDLETIHACRFLSKRRFDGFAAASAAKEALGPEQWAKRLRYGRHQKSWFTADWGPAPGQAGCRVPTELLLDEDGQGWTTEKHPS